MLLTWLLMPRFEIKCWHRFVFFFLDVSKSQAVQYGTPLSPPCLFYTVFLDQINCSLYGTVDCLALFSQSLDSPVSTHSPKTDSEFSLGVCMSVSGVGVL